MPTVPLPATLAGHPLCRGCALQRPAGEGCAMVEEASDVPLAEFLARRTCFLERHLREFVERYLARRPRTVLLPEDLVQEVFVRLLEDPVARRGAAAHGLGAFCAYLRRTAVHLALEVERHERGRMRCGSCAAYGAWSGLCLAPEHPWTQRTMDALQDPRRLDPACVRYVPRRGSQPLLGPETSREPVTRPGDTAGDVERALLALTAKLPRAALVVRARLLEGQSYEQLAALGVSVRTLKRDYAAGLAFLRKALEPNGNAPAKRAPRLSPARTPGRSRGPEPAS